MYVLVCNNINYVYCKERCNVCKKPCRYFAILDSGRHKGAIGLQLYVHFLPVHTFRSSKKLDKLHLVSLY